VKKWRHEQRLSDEEAEKLYGPEDVRLSRRGGHQDAEQMPSACIDRL
jgi:hypothetical protein